MKTLKVKQKSVELDWNGTKNLRYVMQQRFKNNGYTHVKFGGVIYNASVVSGLVWIDEPV